MPQGPPPRFDPNRDFTLLEPLLPGDGSDGGEAAGHAGATEPKARAVTPRRLLGLAAGEAGPLALGCICLLVASLAQVGVPKLAGGWG